jgi:hypothetical protein
VRLMSFKENSTVDVYVNAHPDTSKVARRRFDAYVTPWNSRSK